MTGANNIRKPIMSMAKVEDTWQCGKLQKGDFKVIGAIGEKNLRKQLSIFYWTALRRTLVGKNSHCFDLVGYLEKRILSLHWNNVFFGFS